MATRKKSTEQSVEACIEPCVEHFIEEPIKQVVKKQSVVSVVRSSDPSSEPIIKRPIKKPTKQSTLESAEQTCTTSKDKESTKEAAKESKLSTKLSTAATTRTRVAGEKPTRAKPTGEKLVGRPSKFCQKLADVISERLTRGESLRKICSDADMPDASTVTRWLADDVDFRAQYVLAREVQADLIAAETLEIADDPGIGMGTVSVAHAKLRIDTRKWYASKIAPKKYGEKITQELTGVNGGAIQTEQLPPLSSLFESE